MATTINRSDIAIHNFCQQHNILCYQGNENNILERLIEATARFPANIIVQATGDNPFIDPEIVDEVIEAFLDDQYDYAGNHFADYYPLGMDVRVMTRASLLRTQALTTDPVDLVHGSYFIYNHPELFRLKKVAPRERCTFPHNLRLTVDEPEDYEFASKLFRLLSFYKKPFNLSDIFDVLKKNPDLFEINQLIKQKLPSEG